MRAHQHLHINKYLTSTHHFCTTIDIHAHVLRWAVSTRMQYAPRTIATKHHTRCPAGERPVDILVHLSRGVAQVLWCTFRTTLAESRAPKLMWAWTAGGGVGLAVLPAGSMPVKPRWQGKLKLGWSRSSLRAAVSPSGCNCLAVSSDVARGPIFICGGGGLRGHGFRCCPH